MFDQIKEFASGFFVTGDPLIYGADVSILLVTAAIIFTLTYFKKWRWLWREWLTSVDHKKNRHYVYSCGVSHDVPGRG